MEGSKVMIPFGVTAGSVGSTRDSAVYANNWLTLEREVLKRR